MVKSRVDRAFRPVSPPANEVAVLARSSPKKIPGQERGSRHTFLRYSCGLVAVGAIVACAAPVDLSAVQKYASTTAAAGTSFSALAADFTASCLRGNAALDGLVYATNSRSVPTISRHTLDRTTYRRGHYCSHSGSWVYIRCAITRADNAAPFGTRDPAATGDL